MATAAGCLASTRSSIRSRCNLAASDPEELARASEIGLSFGYDEVNLNCGCPSERVQSGRFGACLMAEPELVAACVAAMRSAVGDDVPVTVKCRIGIDDQDSEAELARFIECVAAGGCSAFIVHARKAWLQGLSPKENREVPPLDYDRVHRLKAAFPELTIVINGGIGTIGEASAHLKAVDGVMLGRAAYKSPALLGNVDGGLFRGDCLPPPRACRARRDAGLCGGGIGARNPPLFHHAPHDRTHEWTAGREGFSAAPHRGECEGGRRPRCAESSP